MQSRPATQEYRDGWDKIFLPNCYECNGIGWITPIEHNWGPQDVISDRCVVCNGTGKVTGK